MPFEKRYQVDTTSSASDQAKRQYNAVEMSRKNYLDPHDNTGYDSTSYDQRRNIAGRYNHDPSKAEHFYTAIGHGNEFKVEKNAGENENTEGESAGSESYEQRRSRIENAVNEFLRVNHVVAGISESIGINANLQTLRALKTIDEVREAQQYVEQKYGDKSLGIPLFNQLNKRATEIRRNGR